MKRNTLTGARSARIILGKTLIVLFLLVETYPIIWLIFSSLRSPAEFASSPIYALPKGFYYQNYVRAWTVGKMNIYYRNSLIATFSSLFFIILFSATAAFAIAKMKWRLSKPVLLAFLFGIMIPVHVVLIPLFIIYSRTGINNTLWCLIITYVGFGLPISIYLFATYYKYIPNEVMESAVIDGCNIYQVLLWIILPMIKSAVVTNIVIQFIFRWNDLIFAMTFINTTRLKNVQTGLLYFTTEWGSREWGPVFAAISMGVIPIMAMYLILNKLVIKGMTAGSIKG